MNKTLNSQRVVKLAFTQDQIEEQRQFINALENNTANIAFEGNFDEVIGFLKETTNLVDAFNHS